MARSSTPTEVGLDYLQRPFRFVKLVGSEALHWTPVGPVCRDSELAVFSAADAADDLLSLNPYKQPGLREFVVRLQFDGGHDACPLEAMSDKCGYASLFRFLGTSGALRTSKAQQREGKTILAPANRSIESIFEFAAKSAQRAAKTDSDALIAPEIWEDFHSSGLSKSPLPEEFGGAGLWEPRHGERLCAVLRALGAADLSIARLYEGHLNAVGLVCRYGSREQIEDLATDVVAGALSAVWGADDAEGLTIVSGEGGEVLKGRKILASGAGFVTRPLVTAKGPRGQQMCLLDLEPGYVHDISGWQAQGMRATATGTVEFTGRSVGAREIVGDPGDFMQQPHFSGGAWRFCAAHVGATERLVDVFRDHLRSSGRGEDAYQLERLAGCVADATTARFWVEEAARRLASDTDPETIVAFANLTRMVVERSALNVMERVQRGVGLRAFVRPNHVERVCRDLATYLRQPVPDLAMSDGARAFLKTALSVGEF